MAVTDLVLPHVNRPFVEALAEIAPTEGRWAVIGGFAVWAHLGETHRPTLDVDTAAAPTAHQTLVSLGEPSDQEDRRDIAGVRLEIIPVEDPGDDLNHLDEQQQLFIVGHWSAANLTSNRTVRCDELVVTIPVARRLPLLACKMHAWLDRRGAGIDKRGSDGLDIVRLLDTADVDALARDADATGGLRDAVTWAAEEVLVGQAARVARMIQLNTDDTTMSTERVEALGQVLVDALAR
jgi:predicted nucleotidyltransferase